MLRGNRLGLLLGIIVLAAALCVPAVASFGGGGNPHPNGAGGPRRCGTGSGGGDDSPCGSPVHNVDPFTGDLVIWDIPVFYDSVGSLPPFYVSYKAQSSDTGVLGDRWTHSFHAQVIEDPPNGAWVVYGNGRRYYFPSDGQGGYLSPASVYDKLEDHVTYRSLTHRGDSCNCPPSAGSTERNIPNLKDFTPPRAGRGIPRHLRPVGATDLHGGPRRPVLGPHL